MKNFKFIKLITLVFICIFFSFKSYSQTEESLALINSLDGKWTLENNEIKIQEIIVDSTKSKEDLYVIVKNYIVINYRDAKSVIQIDDKENGIIVCKGIYADIRCDEVFFGSAGITTFFHTMKIEIKDYKVRATLYLTDSEVYTPATSAGTYYSPSRTEEKAMTDYFPINKSDKAWATKKFKTRECYLLYRGISRGLSTVERLKNEIISSKPIKIEQSEW